MNELFNWNDTSIVLQHNWIWLLIAFAIGTWVGFQYNRWQMRR
jgi:hypothetical protein